MTAAGEQDLAGPLQQAELAPTRFEGLVQGVINSGVQLLEHCDRVLEMVDGSLTGLRHAPRGMDPAPSL